MNKLTDKEYQLYKDADHDCGNNTGDGCQACELLREYEYEFYLDKKALIKREEI